MSIKMRRGMYANVTSTLGVALALGGTAYASTLVTSAQIQDGTIKNRDVHAETLTGSRIADGTVGLSDLAPDARSAAYSTFHDADVAIGAPTKILTLTVPTTGSYVINAKAAINNGGDDSFLSQCQLSAGDESDATQDQVGPHAEGSVALQIVHEFKSPGIAELTCQTPDAVGWCPDWNGSSAACSASDAKITAVRVSYLTNTAG